MRRLGSLKIQFKRELERNKENVEDIGAIEMFKRKHFNELEESIRTMTASDGITEGTMKYGLKNELKFLMKKASSILKADLLVKEKDDETKEVEKFEAVFEMRKHLIFSDAEYQLLKNRQLKTRKPQSLPIEGDVLKIKQFITTKTAELLQDNVWNGTKFSLLRDLTVCRLTLFNARRGGEPCRLTLKEWAEAENDCWVPVHEVEKVNDPLEKELLKTTKIAYQTGKGNNRLVSLLIPQDSLEAVTTLTNATVRLSAGIHVSNNYVFPFSRQSLDHPSGWYCVNRVANLAGIEDVSKMTATGMRHRASTLFAMLDVSDFERERFYDHMGHSGNINKHGYQAPLAVTAITKVGKQLYQFDNGNFFFLVNFFGSCVKVVGSYTV